MDTVRVDVSYRPLRICWAIKQGDFAAFREAVRTNHALWGGRFNPIVVVDRTSEAQALVEAFRADFVPTSCRLRADFVPASISKL